jgi:hypothetical protein
MTLKNAGHNASQTIFVKKLDLQNVPKLNAFIDPAIS